MTPLSQSKVLRVLQEQKFERVGGHDTIRTDVRIITATNRDLEQMVADGQFRADLYYRLNGFTISLPPLRERADDILILVNHYLTQLNRELGKKVQGISTETRDLLMRYGWPGNVRQLQSVLKQAILHATGPVLLPDFLPAEIRDGGAHATTASAAVHSRTVDNLGAYIEGQLNCGSRTLYADTVAYMERALLSRVLQHTSGNQSQAAKILGITRGSLRNKIRQLHITIDPVVHVGDSALEEEEETAAVGAR
jgi:DNA-binding NtrC family response regulator